MKKVLLLLALCCLILPAQAAGFYDVPEDHWAAGTIRLAVEAGAVTGYGDGSFQPGRDVTAAQFCTMLCRSFLAEEFAAAEEGKYQAMDACLPVLRGTAMERAYQDRGKHWDRFTDQPLTRYDMAQVLYNVAAEQGGLLPGWTGGEETQAEIADWDSIPEGYRTAVSTCWAMGLLRGQSDGRFAGEDHLNRAQAAVIWFRLSDLLGNSQDLAEDPAEEEEASADMPDFGLQGDETVQEMMARINRETPRCEEGRLPNGKLRTAKNIRELLDLVQEGCPDGTVWSATERYDYKSIRYSPAKGCMSFGMAVSDYVFGEEAPLKTLRHFRLLEAGDVVYITGTEVERVLIILEANHEEDFYTACELKLNEKIKWTQWGPISGLIDKAGVTTVYRRW